MRPQVLVPMMFMFILGPHATAIADQPERVLCEHPRSDMCRSLRAGNAFIRYVEHRWVVRDPGGGGLGCRGEHPRWNCTLSEERPDGTFTNCKVAGIVLEKKLGVYEVRHARATRTCAKRRSYPPTQRRSVTSVPSR
jgi:hypothetical protein